MTIETRQESEVEQRVRQLLQFVSSSTRAARIEKVASEDIIATSEMTEISATFDDEEWLTVDEDSDGAETVYRSLSRWERARSGNPDTVAVFWGFMPVRIPATPTEPELFRPLFEVEVEISASAGVQSVREISPFEICDAVLNRLSSSKETFKTFLAEVKSALSEGLLDLTELSERKTLVERIEALPGTRHGFIGDGWLLFGTEQHVSHDELVTSLIDLAGRGIVSNPLRAFVGAQVVPRLGPEMGSGEPLFPLASNREQRAIAVSLDRSPVVVVQGPPGTGKSHTIANLISHFLATGRRVAVTAQKDQALRVLQEKIPADIRPLAVSLAGDQKKGRTAIRGALSQVVESARVPVADRQEALGKARQSIATIDHEIRQLEKQLTVVRAAQGADAPPPPSRPDWEAVRVSPAELAKWLAAMERTFAEVVPDDVPWGTEVPVSRDEYADLVAWLRDTPRGDKQEAQLWLPSLTSLPDLAELELLAAEKARLLNGTPPLAGEPNLDPAYGAQVSALAGSLILGNDRLDASAKLALNSITSAASLAHLEARCTEIRGQIEAVRRAGNERARVGALVSLTGPLDRLDRGLQQLKRRTASTRRVYSVLLFGDSKFAFENCRVDDCAPATQPAIEAAIQELYYRRLLHRVELAWQRTRADVGLPALGGLDASLAAIEIDLAKLEALVSWHHNVWSVVVKSGPALKMRINPWSNMNDAATVASQLKLFERQLGLARVAGQVTSNVAGLIPPRGSAIAGATSAALTSLETGDWLGAQRSFNEIRRLTAIREQSRRAALYLDRIRTVAPQFASILSTSPGPPPPFEEFISSWRWASLDNWLEVAVPAVDPGILNRLVDLRAERRKWIEQLVTASTWASQAESIVRAEASLNSFSKAIANKGKGTGKHAAAHEATIRRLMPELIGELPAWIIPVARLSTISCQNGVPFDVLIVDEASQVPIDGLALLGLANQVVIVGDDQQTAPENPGDGHEAIFTKLKAFDWLPNAETVIGPQSSLFDAANCRFGSGVKLREHFRSLPEIIGFSNANYYHGAMLPLRTALPEPGWQAIRLVPVPDGALHSKNQSNEAEAKRVIELLLELMDEPRHDKRSMGVVTLAKDQAKLINRLIDEHIPSHEIGRCRLRCGEPAEFQGDERDIMILSIGAAPRGDKALAYGFGNEASQRRLNVGLTRAQDLLIVVHSANVKYRPDDPRLRVLAHLNDLISEKPRSVRATSVEVDLADDLIGEGLNATAGYPVGSERLSVGVTTAAGVFGIEIDDDAPFDSGEWLRARERQEVLERAGWIIRRVGSAQYRRNPKAVISELVQAVEEWSGEAYQPPASTAPVATPMPWSPPTAADLETSSPR